MTKEPKPVFSVELPTGDYLVSVHPGYKPRVWKIKTTGEIVGQGRTLKRVAVWDAVRELTIAAESDEGIFEGPCISSARKIDDDK